MHQDAQLYDMSNSHRRDRPTREFATRKITATCKYKARYRQEYIYNITKQLTRTLQQKLDHNHYHTSSSSSCILLYVYAIMNMHIRVSQ